MTSELQDRIARAIYEGRNGRGCKPWVNLPAAHKAPYRADALAAMVATREPTHLMVAHAKSENEESGFLELDSDDFRMSFHAAISAEIEAAERGEHDR